MRLLLAEDEHSLSKALKAILEGNRYSVDAVYDGAEALAYLDAGNYDALILDIMMPKLDGLSVLRRLRAGGSQIPVLMLTAKSEVEDKVLGLDSGANDYLAKPFSTKELLARIRAMTRSRTAQGGTLPQLGNLTLNCASFELSSPHGRLRLPNKERTMINRLRRNFILAAMLSLLLVFLVIVSAINLLDYHDMTAAADEVLVMLAENGGAFPAWESEKLQTLLAKSPEALFTCRYFSVRMAGGTTFLSANTEKISAVDEAGAAEYAWAVRDREKGFYQSFRFLRWEDGEEALFIFLDCGRELESFRSLLVASILVALFGLLSVLVLLLALLKRIMRPVSESYEKQRRFITDAGHEIKTPLTIISADADVLNMEYGESEWLRDIQLQIKRLATLTNDLIYLSKMEENQSKLQMREFSLSALTDELVQSFQALVKTQGKSFIISVQPGVVLRGDEKMIAQAISNLLDNALKYSEPEGTISLKLEKRGRSVFLEVYNTTPAISEENLKNLFDRFYRADPSRNSRTGGHGIGLSIVQAVVLAHKGEVSASSRDGRSLLVSMVLPA